MMTGDESGELQALYLELVRSGVKLKEARARVGVTQKQVWDWINESGEFKRLNAEARAEGELIREWG